MSMKPPVRLRAHSCVALVVAVVSLMAATGAFASSPPDGRAYELVSPPDKLGAIPNFPTSVPNIGFVGFNALTGASADGTSLLWMSVGVFADATSGVQMSYESRRTTSGWETSQASPDPVSPHPFALVSKSIIIDASDDLSSRIIPSREPHDPLIQGAFGGVLKLNVFHQDADRNLTWVSRPNGGVPSTENVDAIYQGRDATASHILFGTPEALTPNAVGLFGMGLYDHSGGVTTLVNVDDLGNPVHPCGATLGALMPGVSFDTGGNFRDAVSADGSRIAFTAPDPNGSDGSCADPAQLYVRKGGVTVEASADQRTIPDPLTNEPARFQGAASDGVDKVYFTSDRALTDTALDGTDGRPLLYEYDVESGDLTLVTPNDDVDPEVVGVVGNADDGSHVYFIALGQLTPDATAGDRNLFVAAGGEITYIGSIDVVAGGLAEVDKLVGPDTQRPARVTADGEHLVFQTLSSIGGYNAAGMQQIYLYDAPDDTLTCVSCPADGSDPVGNAALLQDSIPPMRQTQSRNVTEDGSRVFFDSHDALATKDDNNTTDVYMWEDGEQKLISSGHGGPSFFADSANEGNDVFFVTTERLAPHDIDEDLDFYDARVGNGFPAPPMPPTVCVGDQCQGQPSGTPALPGAKSETVFGDGNASAGTAPSFKVRPISAKARRAFARRGRLTLVLDVGAAGTARAVARASLGGRTRIVARGTEDAARARAVRVRLALSEAAKQRLARAGRLKVTIVVTFTGAGSRKATVVLIQSEQTGR